MFEIVFFFPKNPKTPKLINLSLFVPLLIILIVKKINATKRQTIMIDIFIKIIER